MSTRSMMLVRVTLILATISATSLGCKSEDGSTGGGAGGSSDSPGAGDSETPEVDPVLLDETFDGDALSADYTILNSDKVSGLTVSDGKLTTIPTAQTAWWRGDKNALFVYQNFTQKNFRVTATVRPLKTNSLPNPVDTGHHYAGIMIRDSEALAQNFVSVAAGYQTNCDGANANCILHRSTRNSSPEQRNLSFTGNTRVLRLCKVEERITSLEKADTEGASWSEVSVAERPDLSETLQIGFMAYSFAISGGRLMTVEFLDFKVEAISDASECEE